MDRLDAASPPTSPADAIGVAVRYTKLIAIGPGQLTAGNQVDQRIILVPEKLQDAGNRPAAQGRVQRQVPHRQGRLGHFPYVDFQLNAAWLTAAMTGQILFAWLKLLALAGDLAKAEPKTLRPVNRTSGVGSLVRGTGRLRRF